MQIMLLAIKGSNTNFIFSHAFRVSIPIKVKCGTFPVVFALLTCIVQILKEFPPIYSFFSERKQDASSF